MPAGAFEGRGGGVGVRYVGQTYTTNTTTATNAADGLLDAGLRSDLAQLRREFKGVSLAVNATNLMDSEISVCNSGSCYLSQGRTVIGSVRYRW